MPKSDLSSAASFSLSSSSSSINSSWFNFGESDGGQDSGNELNPTEIQHSDALQTEWIFQLPWATRDAIILNLSQHSQLFCGEKAEAETKKKLANNNMDLYRILDSLPPKSTGPSSHSNKVALDLSFNDKLQIAITLIANQELLFDLDYCSEDSKVKMVKRNNKLIFELLKLPVSVTTDSAIESVSNDPTDRAAKEYAGEVARLNEIIEDCQSELARLQKIIETKHSQLIEQVTRNSILTNEVNRLEKENKRIQRASGGVLEMLGKLSLDVNRKKAEFESELNGVDAFLESNL